MTQGRGGCLGIHLPGFVLERGGWLPDAPVVVVAMTRGAPRVLATSLRAGASGLAPGMSLATARALVLDVHVETLDPEGVREDLRALGRLLERHGPVVRVEPPDGLCLDAGPEVVPAVRAELEGFGHRARIVHAPGPDEALLLARSLDADEVVSAEALPGVLAPLPVEVLDLPAELRADLELAGVRTCGAFARLPAAVLVRRHGAAVVALHARARGDPGPRLPVAPLVVRPVEALRHRTDLLEPVEQLDAVIFVVHALLRDLARDLVRAGRSAVRLELALELEGASPTVHVAVRLGRPARSVERLFPLVRARLEHVRLQAPVVAVEVGLCGDVAHAPVQLGLLDRPEAQEPLPEVCARLQDALGTDAVGVWEPCSSWTPDAEWRFRPWASADAPPEETGESPLRPDPAEAHLAPAEARPRPAVLCREPVVVRVRRDPQERPVAIQLGGAWLGILRADGPERLVGGREGRDGLPGWTRDYWCVAVGERRAWVFRSGEAWFLHGWFDAGVAGALRGRPEPPPQKRSRHAGAPVAHVELLARSHFSFREGASSPEELVTQARALGLAGMALTDRDGLYGSVAFHKAVRAGGPGFRALHGALVAVRMPEGEAPGTLRSLGVLVRDAGGWARLCRWIGEARAADRDHPSLSYARVREDADGLILLPRGDWPASRLAELREAAPERVYRAVSRSLAPGEEARVGALVEEAEALGIPAVAVGDVLAHDASRGDLLDVLTCIRRGTTLARAGRLLAPNAERYLKSPEEMARLFHAWPALLERTVGIAEQCTFSMEALSYVYPQEVVPGGGGEGGYTPSGWLRELCRRGMHARYAGRPPASVARQVAYELGIIERLGFASYFLTVHDIVRFARERGILCQGRGSAANSAVCFVLGVTSVDPAHQSLLFERFISEERGEPPDIDIDFEHERREEVLQYVYERYGRDRAAMVNEVIRWRGRSAVRDVGRAMGLDAERVEHLAGLLDHGRRGPPDPVRLREAGFDPDDPRVVHVHTMCAQLQGAPRHTSVHVGGFVISDPPLCDRAPIEPARMEGRTVLQWDKDDVDALGFVKVDLLSLGMLTAIRRAFDHVRAFHGVQLDLASIPREDPAVYELLCAADSTGVFQVESRAQQGMLPRLKPRCFYDLVVETAIVRPGPIQGGMVHPYLRRRAGEEEVSYVDPRLEPILARTLGVPIFQEQVMAMAVAVGGFTPGEADQLRRAMGAWRRRGALGPIGERLQAGLRANGIPEDYAAQIFAQIQGFAEYGFPESHAASFAHLVYVSAWLRTHHPAAFCAALLDSQPMGFYAPRSLVADAQRHGVEVRPVDVRASSWDCSLEGGVDGPALRLGLRMVRGLGAEDGQRVVAARYVRDFSGLADLARRTGLGRGVLRRLARAGALDGLLEAPSSRTAAWAVGALDAGLFAGIEPSCDVELPPMAPFEALREAYGAVGLDVGEHPLGIVRAQLTHEGVISLAGLSGLAHGTRVEIAGLVAHRQRPGTASGVVFLGLEDETGTANVVVWPTLYERRRSVVRGEPYLRISGIVQRQGAAVSVLAQGVRAVPQIPRLPARSRDFR